MMLRIFIGYDEREAAAYHVCANSLIRHASRPLAITPLALNTLAPYREKHGDGSNAFIYSRFLVPYLCNFTGLALYLDGDMIVKADIAELFSLNDLGKDVMVVKHDYKTKYPTKYLGSSNADYPRKNWSSVILWNCGHYPNRILIPEYIESTPGEVLHRFAWLDDSRIGALPLEWNWLAMEYETNPSAKLIHYTVGTPCFKQYAAFDHQHEWEHEFNLATAPMF